MNHIHTLNRNDLPKLNIRHMQNAGVVCHAFLNFNLNFKYIFYFKTKCENDGIHIFNTDI